MSDSQGLLREVRAEPAGRAATYRTTARLVTGGMAVVYLVAFLSLLPQVRGLLGRRGILPVAEFLDAARGVTGGGWAGWWRVPSLAWASSGDGAMVGICVAGAVASVLLFLEIAPVASAAVCWVLYLSLEAVGQAFLSFQWDILLLEAGFLLLFLVPLGLWPGRRRAAPWRPAVWLFWWLLFRLILESGVVKLASGDPVWRNLTALAYHYWTQPLPNTVAWYAHLLPLWFQRLSAFVTFVVELAVPFLFFLPRRLRMAGGAAVVGLQILIAATGNYGFFNLLTIVLALSLFDDRFWTALLSRMPGGLRLVVLGPKEGEARKPSVGERIRRPVAAAFLVFAVGLGGVQLVRSTGLWNPPPSVLRVWGDLSPFHLVNGYGLFATMTTTRPELSVEGRTADGSWRSLDFRWKPDDPSQRPRQVAPYMPRLDWQMWFAALRAEQTSSGAPASVRYDRWLLRFVERILSGSPAVWGLLGPNPAFRGPGGALRPPNAVRVILYRYRFTDPAARKADGEWWTRRRVGVYLPPVRRTKEGTLRRIGG